MKRHILVSFCAIFAILASSCTVKEYDKTPVPTMISTYSAQHDILKMVPSTDVVTTENSGSISGFFILGTGSLAGSGTSSATMTLRTIEFWWNTERTYYINQVFNRNDVIVNLVEDYGQPTVSFTLKESLLNKDFKWCVEGNQYSYGEDLVKKWLNGEGNCLDPQIFFKKYLYKVIITVNPKDWPTDITLP